jgi:hypothetical protein
VESKKEWAGSDVDLLPNVEECHLALLGDAETLDYLLNVRGFTKEVIAQQKIGLKEKQYFRECGEVKALVYPYLVNGNCVFAKFRSLPPSPKAFASPTGWDAPLYNGEILTDALKEVVFVEGEANSVFLMSKGINCVVGVPGAGVKKTTWIDTIDKLGDSLKKYILYDKDKVGNKAAQEIASKIGYDKCLRIVIPRFEIVVPVDECKLCDDDGLIRTAKETKPCEHKREGKDVIEWFMKGGGTIEAFEELKRTAVLFDVTGVASSLSALDDLEDELNGKLELAPSYITQWNKFNELIGFENGDVLDIVAGAKVGKTSLGLNLIDHMVAAYGEDGLIVCLEMTQKRLARKWVSLVTGFEDTLCTPGSPEAKTKLEEFKLAIVKAKEIQRTRTADLYFAYPQQVKDQEDIFKLMRDCIRRYSIKWIMFDNIQLLCDTIIGGRQGHRTVLLSQISKGLSRIAKDYGIKMIRIVQPKQLEKGAVIESRDVDGSSQIEKDCDGQVLLWRKVLGTKTLSQYEDEAEESEGSTEVFDPLMRVTVPLSRYSSGGKCWMYFDGARSQVKSFVKDKHIALQQNFNNLIPQEQPQKTIEVPMEKI